MGTHHLSAKKVEVWTLPSNNIDTKNFSRLLEILWNDDSNNSIWRLNNSSPDKIQELWIGALHPKMAAVEAHTLL